MGRRSINTTKSGKYMNPTDQARKEARKLELKKNKKQRQMVRAAVLKGKDPIQILEEMEKIDQMEYNVNQPSPLNEKVLKDKRKKLRDTLERVLNMYHRDDPEKWNDFKKKQSEYEHKRNQLVSFFESVRSAQQVTVDEIPLPQINEQPAAPTQIPLPTEVQKPQHTIYSIATALKLQALGQPVREPPGCPPGIAPEINSDGEEVEYARDLLHRPHRESEHRKLDRNGGLDESGIGTAKPNLAAQKVSTANPSLGEFRKDVEPPHKAKTGGEEEAARNKTGPSIELLVPPGTDSVQNLRPPMQKNPPPLNPLIFAGHLRLPPGPPPGRPLLPPGPPPGLSQVRMPPMRMAPPPRMIHFPTPVTSLPGPAVLGLRTPNVLSAAPQLIGAEGGKQQGATITAKPQIRNLSADVTRFVPSTLRIKREDKKFKSANHLALVNELKQKEMMANIHNVKPQTKDDAYMQFMKEMQGLL